MKGMIAVAKNLSDLNEILFRQLERLSDPELTGEALDAEISRTEAITKVSGQFINSANTTLNALKLKNDTMDATLKLPPVLGD